MRRRRLFLLLLCLLPATAWALPEVGAPAPPFTAPDLSREATPVASADLFSGRTTVLSFFATWCKPCEKEIPELRDMVTRYPDKGIQLVLVSLDPGEPEEILAFVQKAGGAGMPVLWDEEGDLMADYGIFNLPTNVVVDPAGTVRLGWQGYLPQRLQDLEAYFVALPSAAKTGTAEAGK